MNKQLLKKLLVFTVILSVLLTLVCQTSFATPSAVTLVESPDGYYTLYKDGAPYFIKGGATMLNGNGADPGFAQLAAAGGNSVRTWGAANDPVMFDAAYSMGLTVCAGLWLNRYYEMDYSDPVQVQQQHDALISYVQANKNHPAILLWGVGNEYEGDGSDPNVWMAVEQIAASIKAIDPDHPTLTVIAGFSPTKVDMIKAYCPSIDIIGFNSYAGLSVFPSYLSALDLDRPYIITEYSTNGQWESPLVHLGANDVPIEKNSYDKANYILDNYNTSIVNPLNSTITKFSLGSYAYFWGLEPIFSGTHTWFETHLLSTYEKLNTVDVLTKAWTGSYPSDRCPTISDISCASASGKEVAPGGKYLAAVTASDPESANITYTWEVRPEIFAQGQPQAPIAGSIVQQSGKYVIFQAPATEGSYRLFVYVRDGSGHAATANFPFYSKPGIAVPPDPAIP